MIPLLKKSAEAEKKKATKGVTLQKLATDAGLPDWKALALFNWGTVEPAEVNRALFETVGWEKAEADPGATVLVPHPDADRELLIPKVWAKQEAFEIDKVHTFRKKPQPDPPVAIRIDSMSKWFIPGQESCDGAYSLEGQDKNAKKVQMEVYGSNYCTLSDWNKGLPKFPSSADLKDTPLYEKQEQASAAARAQKLAITEWKGKVTASTGALGKKNGADDRTINAAFSPYTTVLRYYADDGDKTARIDLNAFWPEFDSSGNAKATSLEIEFAIRGTDRCASTQGGGTLLVWDSKDEVVFRKPLSLAELGKLDSGFKKFAWDGKYSPETKKNSKASDKVIADDMPYRVQVQAHTGPDQANGVAIAAMQTEVRLYVHPKTHMKDLDPYVPETDETTLVLTCSPELLITKPVARGDGTRWIQYQLAKAGFHAGPCDGSNGHAAYKTALRELKRSIPKRKTGADFERHTIDLSEGDDVKDSVEDLAAGAGRQRPWFGSDADRSDLAVDAAQTLLQDRTKKLVVWSDDRHYYTDADWMTSCGPAATAVYNKTIADPAAMSNYALDYTSGDAAVTMKDSEIARPWIPLAAGVPLLSKSQDLTTEATFTEENVKAMAKAIGPIRVDWSVDEIDPAPPVDELIDKTHYDASVARTKAYVEKTLLDKQVTYARKDVKKNAVYTNCPVASGGQRPNPASTYHEKVFGNGDDSLGPWRALADSTYETMLTVVHDNLGQGDADIVATRLGQAGVFFRPSTVGGDGYRVRGQVRFEPKGDYNFPNLDTLKKRYALVPQAQSAKMRVWRKASLRAYLSWSPNNSWSALKTRFLEHFKEAYLHMVYENDDDSIANDISAFFADDAAFKALIKSALKTGAGAAAEDVERAKDANIALHAQRLWPWYSNPQIGIFEASAPDSTWSDAIAKFYSTVSTAFYSLSNVYGLAWVKDIEKKKGKLRGHMVVEFQCGDDYFVQKYECDEATCKKKYYFVEKTKTSNSKLGEDCPAGCGGHLQTLAAKFMGYYTCANGHNNSWGEDTVAGGKFANCDCITVGCAGGIYKGNYLCANGHTSSWDEDDAVGGKYTGAGCVTVGCVGPADLALVDVTEKPAKLTRVQAPMQTYTCGTCAWTGKLFETGAGGDHQGKSCPQAACAGVLASSGAVAAGNKVTMSDRVETSGYTGIPVPSIGNPLGVSLNSKGDHELWAHELAHNRYMEHAANAGGPNNAQHDHYANGTFDWVALNEQVAASKFWDRTCLMTYATHLKTYSAVRDKRIMCGKCILKVRGWKLAGLADPDDTIHD